MQDEFDAIVGPLVTKSMDEFNMGLCLAAIVDSIDNPEEYTEEMIYGVFDMVDMLLGEWRVKYHEEILGLNNADKTTG